MLTGCGARHVDCGFGDHGVDVGRSVGRYGCCVGLLAFLRDYKKGCVCSWSVGELVLGAFRLLLLDSYCIEAFVWYLSGSFVCCINSTSSLLGPADSESRVVLTDLPSCSARVGPICFLYWGHGAVVLSRVLQFSCLVEKEVIRRASANFIPSLFNFHVFNHL